MLYCVVPDAIEVTAFVLPQCVLVDSCKMNARDFMVTLASKDDSARTEHWTLSI